MLQDIRDRSQSWVVKVIIGAVIVTMALFGVESLVGLLGSDGDELVSVNGEPISRQQLDFSLQRAIRSGQIAPEQERQARSELLESMINDLLMDQYIEKGGLYLSEEQIDRFIVTLPEFQDAQGRFSSEQFRNRLAAAGFTPMGFRQQLRVDLERGQLEEGLINSDFALDGERQRLLELQRQLRTFRYHRLSQADLDEPVEVSEEDLASYYEANRDDYLRPEQVMLDYLIVDRGQMAEAVEVDEDALRDAWQAESADADRRVSHIMLTLSDERSRADAVEQLDAIKERLAKGESFADLATELSEDDSSRDQGGDIGVISRGFLGERFDQAAFSLSKGQVSDVVETDNGLHLIQVTEVEQEPFDQARERLAERLALAEVDDTFNERVQRLIDESFAADDLDSVAEALGIERQTTDWLSRGKKSGLFAESGVEQQAFSADVLVEGFNSEVLELDNDRRIVIRVREHREETTLPLSEVRDEVLTAVSEQKTRDALLARGEQILAELREGANSAPADWTQANVTRQQSARLPNVVIDKVFRLPHPEEGQPVFSQAATESGVILIALENVSLEDTSPQTEAFVSRLSQQVRANALLDGLLQYLHDEAKIVRH
ncbi:SurA N-terminal domain-containing protein [Halomonas halocynthiae]|uniref:SurA N-terminal domain-containing protein n=1 Tax=Halomonas halocynthiae TaxID=176290 RepID=UPI00041E4DBE|nr:SurA N-terminal domain-containing protein [Halomonas halocynthiae]